MSFQKSAIAMLSITLLSGCASAGRYYDNDYSSGSSLNSFTANAKVLEATPIYDSVRINNPETRCWQEQVRHRGHGNKSNTPIIAGAILGGALGNQFGGGRGKDAMTVAGALLGGSIGNDYRHNSHRGSYVTTEERCETYDNYREVNELVGYNVKYRYNGNEFWTRTDSDPGKYLRVNVSVSPLE